MADPTNEEKPQNPPPAQNGEPPERGLTGTLSELVLPNSWIIVVRAAGTIVFIASAAAILLKSMFGGSDAFALQQSINSMIKITALSIILLIITFTSRSISLFLSLLVVFSLLLPTSDVIRLIIVATRSDAEIDELYPRDSNVSVNALYQSRQITSDIMTEVRKLSENNALVNSEGISNIENEIQNKIIIHEVRRLAEHVIVRSLDGLLIHLYQQNQEDAEAAGLGTWELHYADHFKFPSDIYSLRNQGLIRMNYDDFDSIQLTSVGLRVAQALDEPDFFLGTRQSDQIIRDLFVDDVCTDPQLASPIVAMNGDTIDINSLDAERWISFSVLDGEHLIVVASEANDPVLSVYDRNSLRLVGRNDDHRERNFDNDETPDEIAQIALDSMDRVLKVTDSAVLSEMNAGEYLLCVHDYWRSPFEAEVAVVRNSTTVSWTE